MNKIPITIATISQYTIPETILFEIPLLNCPKESAPVTNSRNRFMIPLPIVPKKVIQSLRKTGERIAVESGNEEDSYKKTNELITSFLENNPGFKSDYEVAYIQHGKDVECGIYDRYDNAVVLLENRPQKLSYRAFPEGEYLTAYHFGNWRTIGTAYQRMLAYIRQHNLHVEGEYMERYLIDILAVDNPDTYITEITVRLFL